MMTNSEMDQRIEDCRRRFAERREADRELEILQAEMNREKTRKF